MATYQTITEVTANHKILSVVATNLGENAPPALPDGIDKLWQQIAPCLTNERHVAYFRDIPEAAIEGKYPAGYSPNGHEIFIALPAWPTDESQVIDTVAHELHHLARIQNIGYGSTLGEVLVSEGMASWFAQLQSGWTAPWIMGETSPEIWTAVQGEWDSGKYNHREWFYDGSLGKCVGYRVAYQLAKRMLNNEFDLRRSLQATAEEGKKAL